jgi:hypothetical protein
LCIVGSVLGGCLSEVHVLATEDAGASDGGFDNAGRAEQAPGQADVADSCADPADLSHCFNPFNPDGGSPGAMSAPPARTEPRAALADRAECSDTASEIITGIDEIYGLAVTSTKVYAATYDGVARSGRDGGTKDLVVADYVPRILADEQNLFWSSGNLDLNVWSEDGTSSVFLPSHGAIEGISQDDDSIYAISDGFLVRVSKQTKAVSMLVDGSTTPLHWSGTAVDAEHVYFVSYSADGNPLLERIGKDGNGREQLAVDITGLMQPVTLLVDSSYVYIAGNSGLSRVPVAGGHPEILAGLTDASFGQEVPIAQDDSCIYYTSGSALLCLSKADGSQERVLSVDGGTIRALAKNGSDLYLGVYVDGPAFDKKSWVGRVQCQP